MFFGGLTIATNGFSMVFYFATITFDGSGPLVKRCDGFDGSLWSIVMHCLVNMHKLWKRFFVIVLDAAPGNWYSSLLSCLEIKMVPLGREIRLKSFNPNVQK